MFDFLDVAVPIAWGVIAGLGTAVAVAVRLYRRAAPPSLADDAWVQARLRGEDPPAPLPDIERKTGYFDSEDVSPLASAPPSKPWHRPIRTTNAE